jgi:hypothetical protein
VVDSELISEIREAIKKIGDINEIEDVRAAELADAVAKTYLQDRSRVWWWEGLSNRPTVFEYGDELSWPYVQSIVQNENQKIYLFVTDDDPEPWPVFTGSVVDIGRLLAELWRFEYFLTDQSFSWVIFDTHHNTIMVSGATEMQERVGNILMKGKNGVTP